MNSMNRHSAQILWRRLCSLFGKKKTGVNVLPLEILDSETIVRALNRVHIKKDKLQRKVFFPPRGQSAVSAMRELITDFECKRRSKIVCKDEYVGMAVLLVEEIRSTGSFVIDSRQEYMGHVNVEHHLGMFPDAAGEVSDPSLRKRFNDRADSLLKKAIPFIDPKPNESQWSGPRLCLPY
jgi:hypothetical protein